MSIILPELINPSEPHSAAGQELGRVMLPLPPSGRWRSLLRALPSVLVCMTAVGTAIWPLTKAEGQ
jgi:hypothetical protein